MSGNCGHVPRVHDGIVATRAPTPLRCARRGPCRIGQARGQRGRQLQVEEFLHARHRGFVRDGGTQQHNAAGRICLAIIAPFHRRILRSILRRASRREWPSPAPVSSPDVF